MIRRFWIRWQHWAGAPGSFDMNERRPLNIGITCYPTVGGSGVLATALGEDLAQRGHDIHFISYERPFRLPENATHFHFHPVKINDYELFKYPDYTLPLSVRMAEVSRDHQLDILHVHYAVPHATAAILARAMLPPEQQPAVVTTLHGTDTTLLGRDPGYGPAIHHALTCSDAVTTVSDCLRRETHDILGFTGPLNVIYNFYEPRPTQKSREAVRAELGVGNEVLIFHSSNLRPLKRVDLVLETVARIEPRNSFKLLILSGGSFAPFMKDVRRLGLENNVVVREKVNEIEEYVAGGSPLDKAGAYGIQDDYGAVFVTRIEGCFYNVVGLPLSRLHAALREFQTDRSIKKEGR